MGPEPPNDKKDIKKLEALLAEYLDQLDSGNRLDPEKILEDHPDCGLEIIDSLQQFIDLGATEEAPELEVLGDYKVIKKIGQGGMGAVYEAEQISFNRNVALKVLNRFASTSRFKREIEAISRLSHPGIVVLYEAGEHNGLPFFAQELVERGRDGEDEDDRTTETDCCVDLSRDGQEAAHPEEEGQSHVLNEDRFRSQAQVVLQHGIPPRPVPVGSCERPR